MDIHKLVDTVAMLDSKIKELDQMELSKKQVIEKINNEITKICLNLESKAKELEEKVEAKLNVLKNLDNELIKNKALLEKLMSMQNYVDASSSNDNVIADQNGNVIADQKNDTKLQDTSNTNLQESKPKSDLMNNSLEDFIVQQFQQEYRVKYPVNSNYRLTDKEFAIVLSVIREKAKPSNNLSAQIDEYLSSYSQTLSDSQIKILEQEKNNSLAS